MEGKVAIVTGSSRGIGRVIAERLAGLGAKVTINYTGSPEKAAEVVEGIVQKGSQATAIRADLGKVSDIERLFAETIAEFGKVDNLELLVSDKSQWITGQTLRVNGGFI